LTFENKKLSRCVLYGSAVLVASAAVYCGWIHQPAPDIATLLSSAQIMTQMGALDEADKACDEVLRRDPDNLHGWLIRGYLGESRKSTDAALAAYRRALELTDDKALRLDISLSIADILRRAERRSEAVADVDRIEASSGPLPQTERLRGVLALDGGDYDGALRHFAAAKGLKADHDEIAALCAQAHLRRGDRASARRELESGASTCAVKAQVWQALARSYLDGGERRAASEALAFYVKSDKGGQKRIKADPYWSRHAAEDEFRALMN
jgi:predicted Zn-dependent protease